MELELYLLLELNTNYAKYIYSFNEWNCSLELDRIFCPMHPPAIERNKFNNLWNFYNHFLNLFSFRFWKTYMCFRREINSIYIPILIWKSKKYQNRFIYCRSLLEWQRKLTAFIYNIFLFFFFEFINLHHIDLQHYYVNNIVKLLLYNNN